MVGGGPVGMWLAAELHRGGVRPVVLERRAERPPHSKALTIYPRTLEQFAMRGIAGRWTAEGMPVPSSHYAILTNRLELSFLGTRFPYTLFLPQRRTEELLAAHLAELGVPVLREHAVTGLRQNADGVDLDVAAPDGARRLRAAYVVGCDGAGSTVRQAAGIGWAGEPSAWTTILGDTELTDPPQGRALTLNRPGGSIYMVDLGGGRWRIAPIDHATLADPVSKPVTFSDLRASTLRLAGTDFGMRETPDTWLSRVGDEARHAPAYRKGRVLLAGDAAHIHFPAGGAGTQPGPAGCRQPRLEAGRRCPRPGPCRDSRHIFRRTGSGCSGRHRRFSCAVCPVREPDACRNRAARPVQRPAWRARVAAQGSRAAAVRPGYPVRPARRRRPRRRLAGARPGPARRPGAKRVRPAAVREVRSPCALLPGRRGHGGARPGLAGYGRRLR